MWHTTSFLSRVSGRAHVIFFIEKVRANTRLIPVTYLHATDQLKFKTYERIRHPDLYFITAVRRHHAIRFYCAILHEGAFWYPMIPNRLGGSVICLGTEQNVVFRRFQKREHPRLANAFFQSEFVVSGRNTKINPEWDPCLLDTSLAQELLHDSKGFQTALAALEEK